MTTGAIQVRGNQEQHVDSHRACRPPGQHVEPDVVENITAQNAHMKWARRSHQFFLAVRKATATSMAMVATSHRPPDTGSAP